MKDRDARRFALRFFRLEQIRLGDNSRLDLVANKLPNYAFGLVFLDDGQLWRCFSLCRQRAEKAEPPAAQLFTARFPIIQRRDSAPLITDEEIAQLRSVVGKHRRRLLNLGEPRDFARAGGAKVRRNERSTA